MIQDVQNSGVNEIGAFGERDNRHPTHQNNERLFRCFTRLENSLEDVQPYKGWCDDLKALRDAALSRKALADALNDLITREQRMKIKGELKRHHFDVIEVVNYGVRDAREALEQAGIPVRKTGRV